MDASRIADFQLAAELPAAELDELAAAMSEVEVEAGAKVITVDDHGTAVYFVEDGYADVWPRAARRPRLSAPATRSVRSGSC